MNTAISSSNSLDKRIIATGVDATAGISPSATEEPQVAHATTAEQVIAGLERTSDLVQQAIRDNADDIELTVVIPVYNEPETVIQIIQTVQSLPIAKQIIVVNDGSSDGTSASLERVRDWKDVEVLEHAFNRGKGAALQTGFEKARGRFVIVQDADLEYNPQDILKVIEPLQAGECQVVFGSRYLDFAEQDPSRLHRMGNWGLTAMSNLLTGQRLTDMETCYKAFTREVLRSIPIEQSRFGFEPEITAKLSRRGIKIREVGVRYSSRSHHEGKKIGIRDLFAAIYCIVRYSLFK